MTYNKGSISNAGPAIIIGLLVGLICAQLANPSPRLTNAQESAPFDHSQCQYPTRTTNPSDGCDNSEPCDPANAKGGSGECTPPQEQPTPTVTPPAQPPEAARCGGK